MDLPFLLASSQHTWQALIQRLDRSIWGVNFGFFGCLPDETLKRPFANVHDDTEGQHGQFSR